MAFSRSQWARDFLLAMGNGKPALTSIDFVCGWSTYEVVANSGPKFNLLATTQPMNVAGVTNFNSVGVKNYPDYGTGVKANAFTILNGRYPALSQALLNNDAAKLQNPTAEMRANVDTWGTGGGKAGAFVKTGEQHRNDLFNYGNAGSVGSLPPPIVTQSGGPENPTVGPTGGPDLSWLEPMFLAKILIGTILVSISGFFLVKGAMNHGPIKQVIRQIKN